MSTYSKNYKKVTDGYNKILDCIKSSEYLEQLECIPTMIESWLGCVDVYCDEIFFDRSNRHRKKDADKLAESSVSMFEELKSTLQLTMKTLTPEEYDGVFKPVRVKGLNEMMNIID